MLTDRAGGVEFDLGSDGELERVPWTRPGADDAFLALDRDGNGTIDNGRELFGDLTPQHGSPDPNGFLALALFDDILNGGNEDGRISADDMLFEHLLLWHDENHNGYSDSEEMAHVPRPIRVMAMSELPSRRVCISISIFLPGDRAAPPHPAWAADHRTVIARNSPILPDYSR